MQRRHLPATGEHQAVHLHGQALDGHAGDAQRIALPVVSVSVEAFRCGQQGADGALVGIVDVPVERFVWELAVERGAGGVQRAVERGEGAVQPLLAAVPFQVVHIGGHDGRILQQGGMQFILLAERSGGAVGPGKLLGRVGTEALVADGFQALVNGIEVELNIAPVHAVVAADEVQHGQTATGAVGIEHGARRQIPTAEPVHQGDRLFIISALLRIGGQVVGAEGVQVGRLIGPVGIVHFRASIKPLRSMQPEQPGIEAYDRAGQTSIMLQQFRAEVLLVGIHAEVLVVQAHLAEAVAQRDDALPLHQPVEEPIAEVVARAGVLQGEPLHAQQATALLRHHAEAPLAAFHVIGHLALDPQLALELPASGAIAGHGHQERTVHVVVALALDHTRLQRPVHNGLQPLHAFLIHGDGHHRRLRLEALRVVGPPLVQEGVEAGMAVPLQDMVRIPACGRTEHHQGGQDPGKTLAHGAAEGPRRYPAHGISVRAG